jgi:hypothetical protein
MANELDDLPPAPRRPSPTGLGAAALPTLDHVPATAPRVSKEDPRARAAKRAAELMEHIGEIDQGSDDFFVDPRVVPDGWTYQWKRIELLGKEDPAYNVQVARAGWEAVPVSRHPSMMPTNHQGATIDRKGCRLMERPTVIEEAVKDLYKRTARDQVRQKEAQLSGAPAGTFERDNKGNPLVNIKKSVERMSVPKDE